MSTIIVFWTLSIGLFFNWNTTFRRLNFLSYSQGCSFFAIFLKMSYLCPLGLLGTVHLRWARLHHSQSRVKIRCIHESRGARYQEWLCCRGPAAISSIDRSISEGHLRSEPGVGPYHDDNRKQNKINDLELWSKALLKVLFSEIERFVVLWKSSRRFGWIYLLHLHLQSHSYFTTGRSTSNQFVLAPSPFRLTTSNLFFNRTLAVIVLT
jgi:hypothetical protein